MRATCVLVLGLFAAAAAGCGDKDPNKDLKPVDPNATRPTKMSDGNVKGGGDGGSSVPR